jgi:hypothetical protein
MAEGSRATNVHVERPDCGIPTGTGTRAGRVFFGSVELTAFLISNIILVPTFVGKSCLLLRDELTPSQYGNCTLMTARAYTPFFRNPQPGYVSGANIIDMSVVGILAGLLENDKAGNASRIADAYQRVHNEVVIHPEDKVDGIKPDGSFQQHTGIIYDGKRLESILLSPS